MRAHIELGNIFRQHGPAYRKDHRLSTRQLKAMHAIEQCRTASLGGHIDVCDTCTKERISYNSCRDRHCPKCQGLARERWLDARKAQLLPVRYFHLVFTLPKELNLMLLANPTLGYHCLFQAAAQSVLEIAADPKHMGVKAGLMSVLHTWGQNLMYHPHLHCIVPGGGLPISQDKWIHSRAKFFLPVKVLGALFRGKFLALLKKAFNKGQLKFPGELTCLADHSLFNKWLSPLYNKSWVVYAKRPFGGPKQVLEYLGRYTHRVAIANHRIKSLKGGKVSFQWRDYKDEGKQKLMTLKAEEFIRRFLLHILPKGFCKIRYYGFLAPRNRKSEFAKIQKLLNVSPLSTPILSWQELLFARTGIDPNKCPSCETGQMIPQQILKPQRLRAPPKVISSCDTSASLD